MTTKTTPFENGLIQVFDAHTASGESARNSGVYKTYDLRADELPQSGTDDEFDIDAYASELPKEAPELRTGRAWVADALYAGKPTLASLRLRAGLSQTELAGACGIKQPHVSRYESGMHEPGVLQAKVMCSALGVSLDEFVSAFQNSKSE